MEEVVNDKESRKKKLISVLVVVLLLLVITGVAFWFTKTYLIIYPIDGYSMEPTLHDKDYVMLFKTKKVKYDDIIVFWVPTSEKYFVKRVIGVAGDKIEINYSEEDDLYHVYRNGEMLSEENINEPLSPERYNELSVTVPEGKIFVLGDNRLNSSDSHIGNFYAAVEDVQGVAFMKYKGTNIKFLEKQT